MGTRPMGERSDPVPGDPPGHFPGVVLVAHGSARSGASAEPVLSLAQALRARGFPEVRTAFWKEEPFLHQALDATRSPSVLVLPVFLAEGYFSRTVVPRELGLRYGRNRVHGRPVHLLPPLGTAAALDDLVAARAREAAPAGARLSEALLVVLGHGTPRDSGSATAVLDVCARLGGGGACARVAPAFIDQDPRVEDVLARAREPLVLLVPFLVAAGWHGGTTVPEELGLRGGSGGHAGQRIVYADPVGSHAAVADLAEALLHEATMGEGPDAAAMPELSRLEPALAARLGENGSVAMLQVVIQAHGRAGYELRHGADYGSDPEALSELPDAPALERLARRTEDGRHRALRTAADLPRGWRVRASSIQGMVDALVALYGPAISHWHLGESGRLTAASFRETAGRQSGIYARLGHVKATAVELGVRRCCDGLPCLRTRRWGPEPARLHASQAESRTSCLIVPCPAPCPILLTAVLEQVTGSGAEVERDRVQG